MAQADNAINVRPSLDRVGIDCKVTVKDVKTGEEKTIEKVGPSNPFMGGRLHQVITVRPLHNPSAVGRPFRIIRIEKQ